MGTVLVQNAGALPLCPGEHVGAYELEAHIASGGYGSVWRAKNSADNEKVAVKILHPALVSSEEAMSRFALEAEAIAAIKHRGVVGLREIGRLEDGRPFMVTELIEGENLSEISARRGPMSPARAASIIGQLAAALDVVHAAGFVHRDIKSSNVMIAESGRVVLLDFGIAKLASADGPGLTASQFTVGTPSSMAPEQIYGEAVDARTDVYGLGALTYELLTAELPFASSPVMLLASLHLHGERPRPSDVVPTAPAIDAVVARAMATSIEKRFQSTGELATALAAAANEEAKISPKAAALGICVVAKPASDQLVDSSVLDSIETVLEAAGEVLEELGYSCLRETDDIVVYASNLDEANWVSEARKLRALLRLLLTTIERLPEAAGVQFSILCDIGVSRDDLVELAGWGDRARTGEILASGLLVRRLDLDPAGPNRAATALVRLSL